MTLAQRNRLRALFAVTLIVLAVLSLLFRRLLAPVADELMAAQVNNEASDAVNAAIDAQIAAGELAYDKLVTIEKDAAGNVTAIRSNMTGNGHCSNTFQFFLQLHTYSPSFSSLTPSLRTTSSIILDMFTPYSMD